MIESSVVDLAYESILDTRYDAQIHPTQLHLRGHESTFISTISNQQFKSTPDCGSESAMTTERIVVLSACLADFSSAL